MLLSQANTKNPIKNKFIVIILLNIIINCIISITFFVLLKNIMIASFEHLCSSYQYTGVGNKLSDEFYVLSDDQFEITDELLNKLLMQYFFKPV